MSIMQTVYMRAQSQGDKARTANIGRMMTINHNGKRYTASWDSREHFWLLTDEGGAELSRFRAIKPHQMRADVVAWLSN
jgi:hypothetical protein